MKKSLTLILLALATFGNAAHALPFQPNPDAFARYMNSVKWKSGTKVTFSNLSDCQHMKFTEGREGYNCWLGYATISDPMGTKVCEVRTVYAPYNRDISYETKSCRWK